jgi:L-alanine-DL-glutamate epimerase-like enolase superfamily enzyme
MEITDVETYVLDNQTGTQSIPTGSEAVSIDIQSVLAVLHTDERLRGVGESFQHAADVGHAHALARTVKGLGQRLVGDDPSAVRRHWHDLYSRVKRTQAYSALSVLDQALWDLKGKRADLPVYRLLGGGTGELGAYATFPHERDVDELTSVAARLDECGFDAMKIVAGHGVRRDRERIEAVAADLPDGFGLAIDANTSYEFSDALAVATTAAENDLAWFEEPIAHTDVDGVAALRDRVSVPIAGYQTHPTHYPARRHLEADAYDIYQPSVYQGGGITSAFNVSTLVETFNRRLIPHAVGPAVNYAASVHVAAASPACSMIEFAVWDDECSDLGQFVASPYVADQAKLSLTDGTITPPEQPGLGLTIDWGAVEDRQVVDD